MRRFIPVLFLIFILALAACSGTSAPVSSQTSSAPLFGVVDVYDADALMGAIRSGDTTGVNIKADITIGLSSIEEYEKPGFVVTIGEGVTVTMKNNFMPVYFGTESMGGIVNNGTLMITGTFEFAETTLENNGTVQIASGGMLAPCYSTIQNNGEVVIDAGGELRLERETTFNNAAAITNNGMLKISSDGGVLNNLETGTIVNNNTVASVGTYTNAGRFIGEGEPLQ